MFKKFAVIFAVMALVVSCQSKPKQESQPTETETQEQMDEAQPSETPESMEQKEEQETPSEEEKPTETKQEEKGDKSVSDKQEKLTVAGYEITDNEKAVIETNLGTIELVFFPEVAKKHVENFKKLSKEGFYDGIKFHRVIPGFMIQGGDPNSKSDDRSMHGMGGPGYTIDAEFNKRPHLRGTLSMARSQDPNSAGSQFFICVTDVPSLDNKYTVFGHVLKGMDIVDRIVALERDARDNPLEAVVMKSVKIVPVGS